MYYTNVPTIQIVHVTLFGHTCSIVIKRLAIRIVIE